MAMPTKKKKYNARFPPARIKKIMQSDEDVGKVAAAVPVIISRSLEMFVETLLKKANDVTTSRGARTLTPSHLKMCINSETRFDFLKDLVSTVPDLQGDTDDQPLTGLDLSMPTTSAATKVPPPPRLPRQISTGKPRGRPRKTSVDAVTRPQSARQAEDAKPPPKRRKRPKRPKKFVDEDRSDLSEMSEDVEDEDESSSSDQSAAEKILGRSLSCEANGNGAAFTLTVMDRGGTTSPSNKNGLCSGLDRPQQPLVKHPRCTQEVDEDYDC